MSTLTLSSKQVWALVALFIVIVIFAIYNVVVSTSDRNDIIRSNGKILAEVEDIARETVNISSSNHDVLNRVIGNQENIKANQVNIQNISKLNQDIINDLAAHQRKDDKVQNETKAQIADILVIANKVNRIESRQINATARGIEIDHKLDTLIASLPKLNLAISNNTK